MARAFGITPERCEDGKHATAALGLERAELFGKLCDVRREQLLRQVEDALARRTAARRRGNERGLPCSVGARDADAVFPSNREWDIAQDRATSGLEAILVDVEEDTMTAPSYRRRRRDHRGCGL